MTVTLIGTKVTKTYGGEKTKSSFQEAFRKEIVLEDDSWIGFNCILLPGAKLGQGSVLAAQSLLNVEMGENEIWAGIPAKKIGERV